MKPQPPCCLCHKSEASKRTWLCMRERSWVMSTLHTSPRFWRFFIPESKADCRGWRVCARRQLLPMWAVVPPEACSPVATLICAGQDRSCFVSADTVCTCLWLAAAAACGTKLSMWSAQGRLVLHWLKVGKLSHYALRASASCTLVTSSRTSARHAREQRPVCNMLTVTWLD